VYPSRSIIFKNLSLHFSADLVLHDNISPSIISSLILCYDLKFFNQPELALRSDVPILLLIINACSHNIGPDMGLPKFLFVQITQKELH
jgi:hypothetical protein